MTIWDVLSAMVRRWFIVILGVALTAAACYWADTRPGVYSSVNLLTLYPPISKTNPNPLSVTSRSVVDLAGVLATTLSAGDRLRFSSQDVPLSGTGTLDGYSVRQHDNGWQWSPQFDRPEIVLRVTGPTPEAVAARMATLTEEAQQVLTDLQDAQNVKKRNRVTMSADTDNPRIIYEHPSGTRSLLAVGLLGGLLTLQAVLLVDWLARRRHPKPGGPDPLLAGHPAVQEEPLVYR